MDQFRAGAIPKNGPSTSMGGCPTSAFTPHELRKYLMPSWQQLWVLQESVHFRYPVDPNDYSCASYYEIIKKPMDLSSIQSKLAAGAYNDPWEYIDDILLMFDNAYKYNKKTSRVFKYAIRLSEIFQHAIEPVMISMGYCCGNKYSFNPIVIYCYIHQCAIFKDMKYYKYENQNHQVTGFGPEKYILCQKCFESFLGETVTLGNDLTQAKTDVKKSEFTEEKNSERDPEEFVICNICYRRLHKICALHLEFIWPEGFICDNCHAKLGTKRPENKFTAKALPTTHIGDFIENRVQTFFAKKNIKTGQVYIRVLYNVEKVVDLLPHMYDRFVNSGEMSEKYPYKAKALFAFQQIDNVDVCFFGMHWHEFNSECPRPNTSTVYLSYLDSVHFFQPKEYRTEVYHEILLGYLKYVNMLGYTMAHLWACPPGEGTDYIFYSHPPTQKMPKPKRLQDWYKRFLDKGIIERIVFEYKDIVKHMKDENLTSICQIPYYEGDIWPGKFESAIQDFEALKSSNTTKRKRSNSGGDFAATVAPVLARHKREFFFIRLKPTPSDGSFTPILDPDPIMECDLLDGRDGFLNMATANRYEFSSLRRAKYSTMGFLYELHNQSVNKYKYNCNTCRTHIRNRYHCTICEDYDLCARCYQTGNHPHRMLHLCHSTMVEQPSIGERILAKRLEARQQFLQLGARWLVHAFSCRDPECTLLNCIELKEALQHTKECTLKINGVCPECRQLVAIVCAHSKECGKENCVIPCCASVRRQLKTNRLQEIVRKDYRNIDDSECGFSKSCNHLTDAESSTNLVKDEPTSSTSLVDIKQESTSKTSLFDNKENVTSTTNPNEYLRDEPSNEIKLDNDVDNNDKENMNLVTLFEDMSVENAPRKPVSFNKEIDTLMSSLKNMVRIRKRSQEDDTHRPPLKILKIEPFRDSFPNNLLEETIKVYDLECVEDSVIPKSQYDWLQKEVEKHKDQHPVQEYHASNSKPKSSQHKHERYRKQHDNRKSQNDQKDNEEQLPVKLEEIKTEGDRNLTYGKPN